MSDGTATDRLAQLTARFEADPTSRIFLQLAEEYRHHGRVKEALEILERGLKEHPGYLAALVAKGRCHLELGEPELGRDILERVVRQDATQMVANKLLVRAYLETSEPERAKSRLDLYALLNESDPEIEELRRRIRAMMQPQPKAEAPRSETFDVFELIRTPAPPPRAADVFALEPAAPPAAPPAQVTVEAPAPVFVTPAPVIEAPAAPDPSDGDIFPGLSAPGAVQRYLASLSAEGLFQVEPPAPPEPPPPVAVAAPPPVVEPIATATLGDLYLSQGHSEEAERIFQEVLRREPGNPAALAGLARLAPASVPVPAPVAAAAVLPAGESNRAKRARLLRAYLQRIQRGRQRNVS